MTTATGLHYLPLHELARRIQSKDVSSAEVTAALLERIDRLNPKLNAYITVMADSALADAHRRGALTIWFAIVGVFDRLDYAAMSTMQ